MTAGLIDYGLNIYEDGRIVFRSIRCPHDGAVRVRQISTAQVAMIVTSFKVAKIGEYQACYTIVSDADVETIGFYEGTSASVVSGSEATSALAGLRWLVELTAETGGWVR